MLWLVLQILGAFFAVSLAFTALCCVIVIRFQRGTPVITDEGPTP